jgi:hypothetical protein
MRANARNITAESRDRGVGGFLVWTVVYALFMVALIVLHGDGRSLGIRDAGFSEVAIR